MGVEVAVSATWAVGVETERSDLGVAALRDFGVIVLLALGVITNDRPMANPIGNNKHCN